MIKPTNSQVCNTQSCIEASGCSKMNNGCESRYVAYCGTSLDCALDFTMVWDGPPASSLTNGNSWTWNTSCSREGVIKQWRGWHSCGGTVEHRATKNGYIYRFYVYNAWPTRQCGRSGGGYQRGNAQLDRLPT